MTDPDLLEYYANLLIIQYRVKPKAIDTIKLLANLTLNDGLIQQEQTCFNLDVAEGEQLNVLGRIVGVPRQIYGLDLEHEFFNFTRAATEPASNGFCLSTADPYPDGVLWLRANQSGSSFYSLTDYEMKLMIRLKIALNVANSSMSDIVGIFNTYFPEDVIVTDNFDMTLTYTISSTLADFTAAALFLGFVPRPMGVELDIVYT